LNDDLTHLGAVDRLRREGAPEGESVQVGGELEMPLKKADGTWLGALANAAVNSAIKLDGVAPKDFRISDLEATRVRLDWCLDLQEPTGMGDTLPVIFKAKVGKSRLSISFFYPSLQQERLVHESGEPPRVGFYSIPYVTIETGFGGIGGAMDRLVASQTGRTPFARQARGPRGPASDVEFFEEGIEEVGALVDSHLHPFHGDLQVAFAEARDGIPSHVLLKQGSNEHLVAQLLTCWAERAEYRERSKQFAQRRKSRVAAAKDSPERKELIERLATQAFEWCIVARRVLEERAKDRLHDGGFIRNSDMAWWFRRMGSFPVDNEQSLQGLLENALDEESGKGISPRSRRKVQAATENIPTDELFSDFATQLASEWDYEFLKDLSHRAVYSLTGPGDPFVDAVWADEELNSVLSEAAEAIVDYFDTQVFHIGPLRQGPGRTQAHVESVTDRSVGVQGEGTVSVLAEHSSRKVMCPSQDPNEPADEKSLEEALNYWMGEGGLELFDSADAALGAGYVHTFLMNVSGLDEARYLPEVGVGVSQVLPVVVQCLLAPPGSLVLLQQPELHLHPAAQQRLGDFLLACARSGRRIVLETHSEYIVSRLARRVVEDASEATSRLVSVLVTRDDPESENGGTSYVEAAIDKFGEIEWPVGFFDQGVSEALHILQAGLDKQEREREDPS